MDPFVDTTARYERVIRDPRDGHEWHATYKPLTAGDRAVLQDLTRMSVNTEEGEEQSAEMRLGAAQILTLDRAIIDWDLPLSKTRATIEALHPDIFDLLFAEISWGSIPEDTELEAEATVDPLPSTSGSAGESAAVPDDSPPSSDRQETSPEEP